VVEPEYYLTGSVRVSGELKPNSCFRASTVGYNASRDRPCQTLRSLGPPEKLYGFLDKTNRIFALIPDVLP
jgi:hypothetical protein